MRISDALVIALPLALLTACDASDRTANTHVLAKAEAEQDADAADDGMVLCSQGGAPLRRDCTVDRQQTDRGLMLTLRHSSGAFRRLLVTTDGRGVVAADGAQPATVTIVAPDQIEVDIAGDAYRLPATVKGGAARSAAGQAGAAGSAGKGR